MRNEKNIGYIAGNKRAITSLSLTYKISTVIFIKGSKHAQKSKVIFLVKINQ